MLVVPELNFKKTVEEISDFIRGVVDDAKASGIVIGLSGGVDSSLTTTLCVKALGRNKVLGIMMPTDFTPQEDVKDAHELAEQLGIETKIINISNICRSFFKALQVDYKNTRQKIPMGNVRARVRMIILYYLSHYSSV